MKTRVKVCGVRLAGSVYDAAHDGYRYWFGHIGQFSLQLIDDWSQVHLHPPASGAGGRAIGVAEGLTWGKPRPILDRVSGQ